MRRLLAVVPDTLRGRRDQAIILTLVLTGRRRAEVMGVEAGATHPASAAAADIFRDPSKRLWLSKGGTAWVRVV